MKRSRSLVRAWSGLPSAMYAPAPSAVAATLGAVVVLGVFPTELAYATWTIGLGYFGAACASKFLYLVPTIAYLSIASGLAT